MRAQQHGLHPGTPAGWLTVVGGQHLLRPHHNEPSCVYPPERVGVGSAEEDNHFVKWRAHRVCRMCGHVLLQALLVAHFIRLPVQK